MRMIIRTGWQSTNSLPPARTDETDVDDDMEPVLLALIGVSDWMGDALRMPVGLDVEFYVPINLI